ncbi:pentapeptide repeat-containing protein [Streptomyces chartreusis]
MTGNRRPHPAPDDRELRLWRVGRALTLTFAAAVLAAASVFYSLVALLDIQEIGSTTKLDAKTLFDLVKLSFGVVAGAGALVALVVAYRRQRVDEAGAHRDATRLHTERFTTAVSQLGDESAAVRLGGVHALAGLADDAPDDNLRQTCIDVLCAYLQLPFTPDPGDDPAHEEEHHRYLAFRKVRHTILRLISDHYRRPRGTHRSWQGCDLDLTDITIDGNMDFGGVDFSGGEVSFDRATFAGWVSFDRATFSGGRVSFAHATFSGGNVSFLGATFCGARVLFTNATFSSGRVSFHGARFSGGGVSFNRATFSDGDVSFGDTVFASGSVSFRDAVFASGPISFMKAAFSGSRVSFRRAAFSGSLVWFGNATFTDGEVEFVDTAFSGGRVQFANTTFSGAEVVFLRAAFTSGVVSFRSARLFGNREISFTNATGSAPDGLLAAASTASGPVALPPTWLSPNP